MESSSSSSALSFLLREPATFFGADGFLSSELGVSSLIFFLGGFLAFPFVDARVFVPFKWTLSSSSSLSSALTFLGLAATPLTRFLGGEDARGTSSSLEDSLASFLRLKPREEEEGVG